MTSIVRLFVCPLLCLCASDDAWLCCTVWFNIFGVTLVCGRVSQSIYVLGLLRLHLNLSHAATSRPLGK